MDFLFLAEGGFALFGFLGLGIDGFDRELGLVDEITTERGVVIIGLCSEKPCNTTSSEVEPVDPTKLAMVYLMSLTYALICSVVHFLVSKYSSPVRGCGTVPPNKYRYLPSLIS